MWLSLLGRFITCFPHTSIPRIKAPFKRAWDGQDTTLLISGHGSATDRQAVKETTLSSGVSFWTPKNDHTQMLRRSGGGRLVEVCTQAILCPVPRGSRCVGSAPESPFVTGRANSSKPGPTSFRAFPGNTTGLGTITKEGFWAPWHVFEISCKNNASDTQMSDREKEMKKIRSEFLPSFSHGILLRPVQNQIQLRHFWPSDEGYTAQGTLFAVCSSNKITTKTFQKHESHRWLFQGVYEWPENVALPESLDAHWTNGRSWIWLA
jgi:hypothetical protein